MLVIIVSLKSRAREKNVAGNLKLTAKEPKSLGRVKSSLTVSEIVKGRCRVRGFRSRRAKRTESGHDQKVFSFKSGKNERGKTGKKLAAD